ncbi:ejaculatory bulb-specific protein 3-like [Maniola jurtina]|uniref:ejaculatory bulb-specific protein 3-like n=1 Tax=Maniola jurtina TaxID=191418 RepID=UPI001E688891|nr:ejaculatory bulb-specific protein 3-like [Maniola jurtina]
MWPVRFVILLFTPVLADVTTPGTDRTVSDGVTSIGSNVVHGDEALTVVNQVVGEEEKWNAMTKSADVYLALPPLPAQDVKCLISVDRYCSKDMGKMKNILIQALKDDCSKCSKEEKVSAGRVLASMMAHDPTAWKLFLTRYDSLNKIQRTLG